MGKYIRECTGRLKFSILKSMKILNLEMKLFLGKVWY
jgi:hypothetical protein